MVSISLPIQKITSPALTVPSLSHLTSCTPTKSNLYLANSLAAAINEPTLYRLLIFHVPNRMSLFCFIKLRDTREYFVTRVVSRGGVVSPSPNPQAGGPLFSSILITVPRVARDVFCPLQPSPACCSKAA